MKDNQQEVTLSGMVAYLKWIAAIITAMSVILGAAWKATSTINDTLTDAISKQTVLMHEMYLDDLRKRIMIQESQIEWYKNNFGSAPEWLIFSKRLTEDQLENAKQWKK